MSKFRIIFAVVAFFLAGPAWAAVMIPADSHQVAIGKQMDVLLDPEGSWTLEQVSGQFASRFHSNNSTALNFGFTASTVWLRVVLDASDVSGESWYLVERYPILDELVLFSPDGQGGYSREMVGDLLPFDQRRIQHRAFIFALDTDLQGPQEYYLRVRGQGALNLLPMLYSAQGLVEQTYAAQLRTGLFYGALLIMLLYNILLFLSLRDRVYLYFVVFMLGIVYFNLNVNGLGLQYLWPNMPRINEYFWVGSYICSAGLAMYSRRFLQLDTRFPRYDRLVRGYLLILLGAFALGWLLPVPYSYHLATAITLLTVLLFSWLGWATWQQGFRVARLYVLAWSVFLLLIFVFAIGNLGFIGFSTALSYLPHTGALWVVVMLSLALGDRIRFLEHERNQLSWEAQQNLQSHLADIEQMNKDKSTFLQYISHELNTPINWIGAANNLDEERKAESDVWALVRKGQRRLVGIVSTSLRYFDLADRPQMPLLTSCQPMWLMEEVGHDKAALMAQRGQTLNNRISPNLQVRACDKELREVLSMALDNALRFSADEGRVDVTSSINLAGGYADIAVRDYGKGMAAESLARIFEPFFVAGSRHHEEGFGLSLAMARVMIEQVGGKVWADSAGVGQGFTLTIRLPLI